MSDLRDTLLHKPKNGYDRLSPAVTGGGKHSVRLIEHIIYFLYQSDRNTVQTYRIVCFRYFLFRLGCFY